VGDDETWDRKGTDPLFALYLLTVTLFLKPNFQRPMYRMPGSFTGKANKATLLNEFCQITGHERKYATAEATKTRSTAF